jgi:hypothetical protein
VRRRRAARFRRKGSHDGGDKAWHTTARLIGGDQTGGAGHFCQSGAPHVSPNGEVRIDETTGEIAPAYPFAAHHRLGIAWSSAGAVLNGRRAWCRRYVQLRCDDRIGLPAVQDKHSSDYDRAPDRFELIALRYGTYEFDNSSLPLTGSRRKN